MRESKDFHCKNRDCRAVLGVTDGLALTCGPAAFEMMVTVTCVKCATKRVWRPVPAPKETPAPPEDAKTIAPCAENVLE